jgi:hypothetical protein
MITQDSKGPALEKAQDSGAGHQADRKDEPAATLTHAARWVQAAAPSMPRWR